jgi:hypothetical protein
VSNGHQPGSNQLRAEFCKGGREEGAAVQLIVDSQFCISTETSVTEKRLVKTLKRNSHC